MIQITSVVAFLTNRLPLLTRICIKSSFISSDYTTTEDIQPNLPNTIYFSVDDFNRGGEITKPGEDMPLPYNLTKEVYRRRTLTVQSYSLGGALGESSLIPFLVPCRKVRLTSSARVPI